MIHETFWQMLTHPLWGAGYQFWSGIAGSFVVSLPPWIVALVLFIRHKNCHHKRCWSIFTHLHPDHGWPVCKKHYHEVPDHVVAN